MKYKEIQLFVIVLQGSIQLVTQYDTWIVLQGSVQLVTQNDTWIVLQGSIQLVTQNDTWIDFWDCDLNR